jgi:hypothetical protein
MTYLQRTLGAVTALLLAAAPALAQSTDPAWLDDLSDQLAIEEDCAVEFYINIAEGKLGGRNTYEARAQCRDGRQFDASRIENDDKFTIAPCGVQVC